MLVFLNDLRVLYRAERRLKRGEIEPEDFARLREEMSNPEAAFGFLRAALLVVLHMPLLHLLFWAGMVTFVPLAASLLAGAPGRMQFLFLAYIVVRLGLGVQDSWLMVRASRRGEVPFTSGISATLLGTLPYRHNRVVGPLLWTAFELGMYAGLVSIPGLVLDLQGLLGDLIPGIMAVGILQVTWHTMVRMGVNGLIVLEAPKLSDPDTIRRSRETLWRVVNALTGRGTAEVETANRIWDRLNGDLDAAAWDSLDGELEGFSSGSQERIRRFLLAVRKDALLAEQLLQQEPGAVSGVRP